MEKFAISIKKCEFPYARPRQGILCITLWKCGEVKIDALSMVSLTSLGLTISKCSSKQQNEFYLDFYSKI